MISPPVCAIDCGTNSTRLLIIDGAGATMVREMRITRLGQGVDATGRLAPEALERTLGVLAEYRALMDAAGVVRGRLAATSAARDAANGPDFLAAASEITGLDAEILSGEEEGRLSFAGAMAGLEPAAGADLVLDIGGGSTEIVLSDDHGLRAHSMQVGCVRVAERTLHSDPATPDELADAMAMAEEALDGAFAAIEGLGSLPVGSRLVGLAGTVATLAMIDGDVLEYDRDLVHHRWLSRDAVVRWTSLLASETSAERSRRPGMVSGREDVIVGGLIVLKTALERLDLEGCLTSESDILDGLAASQLEA
jgi:exopolyphosphatase/guanosine-5'-triphosphate,3'-diphosphate pyrophosphatase